MQAPFVPALDSEIDAGYYDDFTNPEDMAKYAEVQEKQRNVDKVKEKEEDGVIEDRMSTRMMRVIGDREQLA